MTWGVQNWLCCWRLLLVCAVTLSDCTIWFPLVCFLHSVCFVSLYVIIKPPLSFLLMLDYFNIYFLCQQFERYVFGCVCLFCLSAGLYKNNRSDCHKTCYKGIVQPVLEEIIYDSRIEKLTIVPARSEYLTYTGYPPFWKVHCVWWRFALS